MLTQIKRETYGNDTRAINKHTAITYLDEVNNNLYILSKTLDAYPPFYEALGPFKSDFAGITPQLKVEGNYYWGSGISWAEAKKMFCDVVGQKINEWKKIRRTDEYTQWQNGRKKEFLVVQQDKNNAAYWHVFHLPGLKDLPDITLKTVENREEAESYALEWIAEGNGR